VIESRTECKLPQRRRNNGQTYLYQ
jgi:hypothetical protein